MGGLIEELHEQVSTLFKNHTDLLAEFSKFLSDQPAGGTGGMLPLNMRPKNISLPGFDARSR